MFEKVLVCLDGSPLSEQILPHVIGEAQCCKSKLVLLHVVPEPFIATPGIPGVAGGPMKTPGGLEQLKKEQDEAGVYLEKMAAGLREKGIATETLVLEGDAGQAIIDYAHENDIGLIAIATHGRGGLGRVFFGSVADYVLKNSGLPVLLIRPKEA
jgi:nucleotide-binding universal stress UspA family protein